MEGSLFKFAFVVEGHGEVEALPLLVRRICNEIAWLFRLWHDATGLRIEIVANPAR
jgi:hypothetical protein